MNPTCGPFPWVITSRTSGSRRRAVRWAQVCSMAWYWSGTVWCDRSVMSEFPPTATTTVLGMRHLP